MSEINNGEIKVEKGFAIPTLKANSKYPWHDLAIGDSFFVPGKLITQMSVTEPNRRLKPRKFTARTRTLKDDGEEGVRVWRVE